MSVDVRASGASFEVGAPKLLFRTQILGGLGGGSTSAWRYAVSKDGQRFLINSTGDEKSSSPVTITTQWTDLLKK